MTQKAEGKTGDASKQVSVRVVEKIILLEESQSKLLDELHIQKLSCLHTADRPFTVLTVTQKAMTGTMDYCSSLSCRYSNCIYLFPCSRY